MGYTKILHSGGKIGKFGMNSMIAEQQLLVSSFSINFKHLNQKKHVCFNLGKCVQKICYVSFVYGTSKTKPVLSLCILAKGVFP